MSSRHQSLAHSFHTLTMVPPAVTDWVTDFGTSNHTTFNVGNLTSVRPPLPTDHSSIVVGNKSSLPVTSIGNTALLDPFYLNNVLVTPDIIQNLLSVHHFTTDNWCSMKFDPFGLSVKDLSTRNVLTRCNSSRPLYTMRLPSRSAPSPCAAPAVALVASASTWHHRLGHPGVDALSKLSSDSSVICSRHSHDFCQACQLGCHTRMPFVSSTSRADNNFDLIHCDLWTSPVVSVSGYKYYLVILDLTLCGLFPCQLKLSSVTMVGSLTTPPFDHSSPLIGWFCGCSATTLLHRTVNLSVLFAPLIT
jgi:hypothetical protein